mgnify:CR=1 FL=1
MLAACRGRDLDCELKQFRLAGDVLMEAGAALELWCAASGGRRGAGCMLGAPPPPPPPPPLFVLVRHARWTRRCARSHARAAGLLLQRLPRTAPPRCTCCFPATACACTVNLATALLTPTATCCSTAMVPGAFLPLACTANLAKNLAAVAIVSTRAPIYRTFAKRNNLADVTAKGGWEGGGWWMCLKRGAGRQAATVAEQPHVCKATQLAGVRGQPGWLGACGAPGRRDRAGCPLSKQERDSAARDTDPRVTALTPPLSPPFPLALATGESVANLADVVGTALGIALAKTSLPVVPTFALLSVGYLLASRWVAPGAFCA